MVYVMSLKQHMKMNVINKNYVFIKCLCKYSYFCYRCTNTYMMMVLTEVESACRQLIKCFKCHCHEIALSSSSILLRLKFVVFNNVDNDTNELLFSHILCVEKYANILQTQKHHEHQFSNAPHSYVTSSTAKC